MDTEDDDVLTPTQLKLTMCVKVTDSGIDTDMMSDTTSINSRNYEFKYRDGRRYHGVDDALYSLPNDDPEINRLDELHHCMRSLLGSNIVAKIVERPTLILDLGCGSGLWCLEVADEFPNTRVVGVDISPQQPTTDVPLNCDFLLDNLLDGIPFDTGSVDLIHSRAVMAGVPESAWPSYVGEAFRVLKPGTGVAIFIEMNPRSKSDTEDLSKTYLRQWEDLVLPPIEEKGMILGGHRLFEFVSGAGFTDIEVRQFKLPCGMWANSRAERQAGRHAIQIWLGIVDSLEPPLKMSTPQWTPEYRQDFISKVKSDVTNNKLHLYADMHCVIGRKPNFDD